VFFEGNGFRLRPNGGGGGLASLSGLAWGNFITCNGLGAGIGVDCWGAAQPAVRYDSPTWGGFRFETSYGTNALTGPFVQDTFPFVTSAEDADFWDIAVFYNGDWGNFKVSAAYAYTWIETAAVTTGFGPLGIPDRNGSSDLHQVGATVMHTPSGLGIYGMYQNESTGGQFWSELSWQYQGFADTDAWYLKPFIKRTWNPAGATVFYGEYGQYNDMFGGIAGTDVCGVLGVAGSNVGNFCAGGGIADVRDVVVTGSEVERWGLGVVQEIDSAAMHVFARWQHQEANIDLVGENFNFVTGVETSGRIGSGFDDWDLFQVGGIIFF
jgi:hypothetical protein